MKKRIWRDCSSCSRWLEQKKSGEYDVGERRGLQISDQYKIIYIRKNSARSMKTIEKKKCTFRWTCCRHRLPSY